MTTDNVAGWGGRPWVLTLETRTGLGMSPDTWLYGEGSWGICLRAPVGCFPGGRLSLAQGHWRWNLILTDLPAFPHSSQLRLQSLRERTRSPASHLSLNPA